MPTTQLRWLSRRTPGEVSMTLQQLWTFERDDGSAYSEWRDVPIIYEHQR